MIYLYTYSVNGIQCGGCAERKKELEKTKTPYKERDGHYLTEHPGDGKWDVIDIEAMAQLAVQDWVFPVEVEANENDEGKKIGRARDVR